MKKYLSLFLVLLVGLCVFTVAKAEETFTPETAEPILYKPTSGTGTGGYSAGDGRPQNSGALMPVTTGIPEDDQSDDSKDQREMLKEKAEKMREEAKKKMEEMRKKLEAEKSTAKKRAGEQILKSRENIMLGLDKAVTKINNLKDRVNSQKTKVAGLGFDTTSADSHIANAEQKLTEAKAKIAEAHSLLAQSVSELSKENKEKLRTLIQEAQNLLREAHKSLNQAVKALKEAVKQKVPMVVEYSQPSITFTAEPDSVPLGGTTTLKWVAQNATSCVGSGGTAGWEGQQPTSGKYTTLPINTANFEFVLSCENSVGGTSAKLNIAVYQE